MPIYVYQCDTEDEGCGHTFEEIQGFTDEPLTVCPKCGKKLKKLISAPGAIIFKGSGFFCNDYPKDDRPSTEA